MKKHPKITLKVLGVEKPGSLPAKVIDPKQKYDLVTGSQSPAGGGNKRRQAIIEVTGEDGVSGQLSDFNRLMALNLARDSERNYSVAKSLLKQYRNNVVGSDAKVQVNTDDDFGKTATDWFNKIFFNSCDFRSTEDFSKICRNIIAAKKREGDILVVFDDGETLNIVPGGTGKIICYDADQLVNLTNEKDLPKGCSQNAGIIYDEYGREVGYIVSKKRGQQTADLKDVTIYRRDPNDEDKNSVRLIKSTWRVNQGRGTADMLSALPAMLDCYEMLAKELQTAKVTASLAGTISRKESMTDFDDARLDPTNENPDPAVEGEIAATLPEEQSAPTYERLEALTGGLFDYLADGDVFNLHDIKRPNVHMAEFINHVTDAAGAAFGMAHSYTQMRADTSYTAFRGDMILTWVTFYVEQKDLEREWLDWVAVRAIRWALKTGKITVAAPEFWEQKVSWHLPKMPHVDELKERQANALGLKNGELDFSDLLGPNWLEKFTAVAKQLDAARKLGLPLNIFEQKSGGMADPSQQKFSSDKQQKEDTDNEEQT